MDMNPTIALTYCLVKVSGLKLQADKLHIIRIPEKVCKVWGGEKIHEVIMAEFFPNVMKIINH